MIFKHNNYLENKTWMLKELIQMVWFPQLWQNSLREANAVSSEKNEQLSGPTGPTGKILNVPTLDLTSTDPVDFQK